MYKGLQRTGPGFSCRHKHSLESRRDARCTSVRTSRRQARASGASCDLSAMPSTGHGHRGRRAAAQSRRGGYRAGATGRHRRAIRDGAYGGDDEEVILNEEAAEDEEIVVIYHVRAVGPALSDFVCGRVEVRPSGIHGDGLFAVDAIRRGALVGEYEGEHISELGADMWDARSLQRGLGCYFICVVVDHRDSLDDIVVDATLCGNLTRFMNH